MRSMASPGDNEVRIDITGSVEGLKAVTPQAVAEINKVDAAVGKQSSTTRDANAQAEKFISTLKREAETFGMTRGEVAAYDAEMQGLTGTNLDSVKALGSQLDALNENEKAMQRMKIAATVAGAAIGFVLVQSIRQMYQEVTDGEQSAARLEAVYRATGGAVKLTLAEIQAMNDQLYHSTLFDDDEIAHATSIMLTFKGVTGDTFRQAMQMSADLAAVMGTDLNSAVVQLGKALEDPEQGLQALRRVGVSFTDDQKNLIKAMVETGHQGEALTEIMRIMREQGFDKTAESMKKGITKAADDLSKSWKDLLQTIGETEAVSGTVDRVMERTSLWLTDMKNVIESGNWVDKFLAVATLGGYKSDAIIAMRNPQQHGASGSWGDPAAPAPEDPAIAQAAACYSKGGKWDNQTKSCVMPRSRKGPKPTPYADVFTGQEYSRAQLNEAASGQLGGFSYITNDKSTTKFLREQQDAVNQLQGDLANAALKAEKDQATQQEKNAKALDSMKEKYLDLGDPLRQYYQQLDDIAVLQEKFPELSNVWLEAELNVHEKIDAAMNKTKDTGKNAFDDLKKSIEGWGKDASNAFADWATGAKGSIADVGKAWVREMLSMVAQKNVFGPLASSGGDFITNIFGSLLGSAQGNAFSGQTGLSAYRNTVVSQPTVFPFAQGVGLMGEKPGSPGEAIMPLTRMNGGDLGVKVAGGGATVIINLIESPGNGGQTQQRQDNNGTNIFDVYVEKIKGSIAGDISQGRGAIPDALTGTYGLNRVAGAY